jgi:hypothetical protein
MIKMKNDKSIRACKTCISTSSSQFTRCSKCEAILVQNGKPCPCGDKSKNTISIRNWDYTSDFVPKKLSNQDDILLGFEFEIEHKKNTPRNESLDEIDIEGEEDLETPYGEDSDWGEDSGRPQSNWGDALSRISQPRRAPEPLRSERERQSSSLTNELLGILAKYDWIYIKHDGTLESGIEIVTKPLGIRWIYNNFNKFDDIFNLKKYGWYARTAETAGFHIHISKSAFSTLHLYKFIKFFTVNQQFIKFISSRPWNNLIKWALFEEESNIKSVARAKHNRDKHMAVNLSNNDSVEVRIFRGTLNPIAFKRNIEFVLSLYWYTKDQSIKGFSSVVGYKSFLSKYKKLYPNLYRFLIDKGAKECAL